MDEIMNSPKGVISGIPERVSISCLVCGPVKILPDLSITFIQIFHDI